jgi:hypothetical protein
VKQTATAQRDATKRNALRRRVSEFYRSFNKADWRYCFAMIDPELTRKGKVEFDTYSGLMQAFKQEYGKVHRWMTRLSLHLDGAPNQGDRRPFAYVYLVWQDDRHAFHMFRERWIVDKGQWFTRVVGLVPNRSVKDQAG